MPRHTHRSAAVTACSLSLLAGIAPAQSIYDGQKVVEVAPENLRQFRAVMAIVDDVWTHTVVMDRPFEVRVGPEEREALQELGVPMRVVIDDLQALVDQERAAIDAIGALDDPNFFLAYHRYDAIEQFTIDLAADNPALVSQRIIGQSTEDRNIRVLTITGPGDPTHRPVVFLTGGQHAREWISPAASMYTAQKLVEGYAVDPRITRLMDSAVFMIVPLTNPDGYEYCWTNDRFWRKNKWRTADGTLRGVDLNRNWDINFGGQGSSGNTTSQTYRGPFAFSEPETVAVRDELLSINNLAMHIDVHSYSQYVLWPYGFTTDPLPEPDATFFPAFSQELADTMYALHGVEYLAFNSMTGLYPASGTHKDWVYDATGAFSWTYELRPAAGAGIGGFVLPTEQIIPNSEELLESVLVMAEAVAEPVRLRRPHAIPDAFVAGETNPIIFSVTDGYATANPDATTVLARFDGYNDFQELLYTDSDGFSVVNIPGAACGREIELYFLLRSTDLHTVQFPPEGALTRSFQNADGSPCQTHPADLNADGVVDADDFFLFLDAFANADPLADLNYDGSIDADDFFAFLRLFAQGS